MHSGFCPAVSEHATRVPVLDHDTLIVDGRAIQGRYDSAESTLVWDGRLDNGRDLARDLGIHSAAASMQDGEIVHAALERWNDAALAKIVGDWSCAWWHGPARTLALASDYMGTRPLYYAETPRGFYWSSNLTWMVRTCGGAEINLDYLAGFLAYAVPVEQTPYRHIKTVPSGGVIKVIDGRLQAPRRYWTYPSAPLRYGDERDYAAHLRELLIEGVDVRMPRSGVAYAELSGGLDSSAIVCIAAHLIDTGRSGARDVQPISHVTLGSPESDERAFMSEVTRAIRREAIELPLEPALDLIDDDTFAVTPQCLRGIRLKTLETVMERGGSVLLTGRAGDSVMGNDARAFLTASEAARDLGLTAGLGEARRWAHAARYTIFEVIGENLLEIMPRRFRTHRKLRRLLHDQHRGPEARPQIEDVYLVRARFRDTIAASLGHSLREGDRYPNPAKRGIVSNVSGYADHRLVESWWSRERAAASHPYLHRPLVEYVLAIPQRLMSPPGHPRALMREALIGLLPERIRLRRSKGHVAPLKERAIRRHRQALAVDPGDLEVVRIGLVDADRLRARLAQSGQGAAISGNLARIWHLERWLENQRSLRTFPGADYARKEVNPHVLREA